MLNIEAIERLTKNGYEMGSESWTKQDYYTFIDKDQLAKFKKQLKELLDKYSIEKK